MTIDAKAQALESLWKTIVQELATLIPHGEPWPYPRTDGVSGWYGTGPLMFVSYVPATLTRWVGTPTDNFYRALRANGLEDSHITDLIKVRSKTEDTDALFQNASLVAKSQGYLMREIEIVRPKAIVVVGTKANEVSVGRIDRDGRVEPGWLKNVRGVELYRRPTGESYIRHYSQRGFFNPNCATDLAKLRTLLDERGMRR